MIKKYPLLIILPLLLSLFFTPFESHSAEILRKKGKKVIIKLFKKDKIEEGDIAYIVDEKKKKVDLVKILRIKGGKAKGKLRSGRGKVGMSLMLKKASKKAMAKKGKKGKKTKTKEPLNLTFQFGTTMNTMSVTNTDTNLTDDLAGSGTLLKFTLDYELAKSVDIRGAVGMFSLVAEKEGCAICKANINYILVGGTLRYTMGKNFIFWPGIGYNVLVPMSSDGTEIINEETITNTGVLTLKMGFDYMFKPNMGIPFEVGYGLFPPSEDVNTSTITVSLGFLYGF